MDRTDWFIRRRGCARCGAQRVNDVQEIIKKDGLAWPAISRCERFKLWIGYFEDTSRVRRLLRFLKLEED